MVTWVFQNYPVVFTQPVFAVVGTLTNLYSDCFIFSFSWYFWHVEVQQRGSRLRTCFVAWCCWHEAIKMRRSNVSFVSSVWSQLGIMSLSSYVIVEEEFKFNSQVTHLHTWSHCIFVISSHHIFSHSSHCIFFIPSLCISIISSHIWGVRQWFWDSHCTEWDAASATSHRGRLHARDPPQVFWSGKFSMTMWFVASVFFFF